MQNANAVCTEALSLHVGMIHLAGPCQAYSKFWPMIPAELNCRVQFCCQKHALSRTKRLLCARTTWERMFCVKGQLFYLQHCRQCRGVQKLCDPAASAFSLQPLTRTSHLVHQMDLWANVDQGTIRRTSHLHGHKGS